MFEIREILEATSGRLVDGGISGRVRGISIDSRTIRPDEAFLALEGDNFDGHDFIAEALRKGASCVIRQAQKTGLAQRKAVPGSVVVIEVGDGIKALSDIASFQRRKFNIPLIAISGSSGKTTTKDMLARILSRKFRVLKNEGTKNNQIGVSLSLLNLHSYHELVVLELGTNHPGEISSLSRICSPNIGIITNIGPAHLEYLGSLSGVLREKYSLIADLKQPRIAVINADDTLITKKAAAGNSPEAIFTFGLRPGCDFCASCIEDTPRGISFWVNRRHNISLSAIGRHNIYNALAAITVARIFGIGYNDIARQLSGFILPEGRLKPAKAGKVNFIDDTYNSNPLSLNRALEAFAHIACLGRKIFVMGDMLELGKRAGEFHIQAGRQVKEVCDAFIAVGKLSRLAAKAAEAAGFNRKNIFTCQTPRQARQVLYRILCVTGKDTVLVKGSRRMKMEEVFQINKHRQQK
ncbi:MAG: UDP-N-acetylmuramoyl-tripeptide--D-alanyl-D-alanine ligase [Candidatus Omnitrophota bacterium]